MYISSHRRIIFTQTSSSHLRIPTTISLIKHTVRIPFIRIMNAHNLHVLTCSTDATLYSSRKKLLSSMYRNIYSVELSRKPRIKFRTSILRGDEQLNIRPPPEQCQRAIGKEKTFHEITNNENHSGNGSGSLTYIRV